jgi:cell division protein FtsB
MESLSLLNLLVTLCLIVGGIAAYRHGFARTANEVQERVIHALQSEIQSLHDRIEALEHENTRLNYTITTMCSALRQRGLHVTIDGDIVSIEDHSGGSYSYNARIFSDDQDRQPAPATPPTTSDSSGSSSTPTVKRRTRKRVQEQA